VDSEIDDNELEGAQIAQPLPGRQMTFNADRDLKS